MEETQLDHYLEALSRDDSYSVDRVLKTSDFETTEEVHRTEPDGTSLGPFIRKTIKRESGLGQVYERIFEEQQKEPQRTFSHIPRLYECYIRDEDLVVVMEYVQGETLQDLIYRRDPSVELAASVFPQICDAVMELHEAFYPPLIHRDLKPSNVMITDHKAIIIDFGIAREYKSQTDSDTVHFGTRSYAPPEQFGYGQTTVRSDIYALGMLLYYCLTEQTPSSQAIKDQFDYPQIPQPLREVLLKATAFDPKSRYATVHELKNAAQNACNQILHPVQPIEPPTLPPYGTHITVHTGDPVLQQPFMPPSYTNKKDLSYYLGIAYNVVLLVLAAFLIAASVYNAVTLPEHSTGRAHWFDVFGYSFAVPAIIISAVIPLLYKRPFVEKFPHIFGNLKRRHYIFIGIGLVAVTILLIAILTPFSKV